MSQVGPVSETTRVGRIEVEPARVKPTEGGRGTDAPSRPGDRVDVSNTAKFLSGLREIPEMRSELVDRVGAEIKDGAYLTPDRIEAAIDGLLEDLHDGLI